jgi:hypothetical protein
MDVYVWCVYVCLCVCVDLRVSVYVCVRMRVWVYVCARVRASGRMCVFVCVCVFLCMCIYVRAFLAKADEANSRDCIREEATKSRKRAAWSRMGHVPKQPLWP